MAKINLESIAGYAEMSAEEKIAALESFEYEDHSDEVSKLKAAMSKASSENADQKRKIADITEKWKAELDEAKRAQVEREEHDKAVEEELISLRRERTVNKRMAKCLALGYDEETAGHMANATANLTDEEADALFGSQAKFLENKQKELEAAALNKQPTLTTGSPPTAQAADLETVNQRRKWMGLPPIK